MRVLRRVLACSALGLLLGGWLSSPPALARDARPPTSEPTIAAAASGVVRIISFATADRAPPQKMETARMARLDHARVAFPFSVAERVAVQGEVCRNNGLVWCPVYRDEARGSAFFLGDAGQFMTCRHLVHDWLYWAGKYNPGREPDTLVPPLALADGENRLLFLSSRAGLRRTLFARHEAFDKPLARLLDRDMFWDSDFLAFRLDQPLPLRPLPLRPPFEAGTRVLVMGYPDELANRGEVLLTFSRGVTVGAKTFGFSTSAGSARGMSGGPILDQNGRVGGMACSAGRKTPGGPRTAIGLPIAPEVLQTELQRRHGVTVVHAP